jgi:hypothetical protein
VCAIGVIGVNNKTDGIEALRGDASIHVTHVTHVMHVMQVMQVIAAIGRTRGALGGARGSTVPVSPHDGSRDLSVREAQRGTVMDGITRGVGSCL